MTKIYEWLEIQFWQVAKWLIRKNFGADCETKDTDDFPEMKNDTQRMQNRCASCEAKEMIDWIDKTVDNIKWFNKWGKYKNEIKA